MHRGVAHGCVPTRETYIVAPVIHQFRKRTAVLILLDVEVTSDTHAGTDAAHVDFAFDAPVVAAFNLRADRFVHKLQTAFAPTEIPLESATCKDPDIVTIRRELDAPYAPVLNVRDEYECRISPDARTVALRTRFSVKHACVCVVFDAANDHVAFPVQPLVPVRIARVYLLGFLARSPHVRATTAVAEYETAQDTGLDGVSRLFKRQQDVALDVLRTASFLHVVEPGDGDDDDRVTLQRVASDGAAARALRSRQSDKADPSDGSPVAWTL